MLRTAGSVLLPNAGAVALALSPLSGDTCRRAYPVPVSGLPHWGPRVNRSFSASHCTFRARVRHPAGVGCFSRTDSINFAAMVNSRPNTGCSQRGLIDDATCAVASSYILCFWNSFKTSHLPHDRIGRRSTVITFPVPRKACSSADLSPCSSSSIDASQNQGNLQLH